MIRIHGNKYGNTKTIVDGIKFDSKKEASRYQELKLMEKGRLIFDLELQPKFVLQEKFKYQGKTERAITYSADFRYKENTPVKSLTYSTHSDEVVKGEFTQLVEIVEDVKGHKTDVYKIKRKMFLKKFPEYEFLET